MKGKTFLKILTALCITGISMIGTPYSSAAEAVKEKISVNGVDREYYLYKPDKPSPPGPRPLLFVLHGGGGSAEQILFKSKAGELTQTAEREGFLVVFPNGTPDQPGSKRYHWNDGRKVERWKAMSTDSDDPAFFEAMIDLFTKKRGADPQKVFAVGISNGGMMVMRLALDLPKRFAAVCSIVANLPVNLKDRQVSAPISILIMNGTADKLMPYKGGYIIDRKDMGEVVSTPETALFWAKANGCNPEPITTLMPDIDPNDGTRVIRMDYPHCLPGVEVILYSIENGGHSWPNSPLDQRYLPESIIGKVSRDLDANQTLWDFFKNKTRKYPG
jgi:polyhydroxybutyrate depolymerase